MRSGSAAIAKKGKIDEMPMTWKSACARESEKMAPSFALPYGRARKRTRRIRSATLWINRDKAVPNYRFKNKGISQRRTLNYLREKLRCQKLRDICLVAAKIFCWPGDSQVNVAVNNQLGVVITPGKLQELRDRLQKLQESDDDQD